MGIQKVIAVIMVLLLLCSPLVTSAANQFPALDAAAVVIYDADFEQVLYAKNPNERRSIASLTKIMTILVICELIQSEKLSLNDVVTASANAASRGGTEIKLSSGDKLTVEELLYATALASANDAAVALAEYVSGSEKAFAELMTKRAWEIGLTDTNFVDCTGLLSIFSGNFSTAYDMAVLSHYAMQNELFRQFVSTKEYTIKSLGRTIRNSNALLHEVEGVNGIKTGSTTPAGHTLITSAVRNGRHVIIVVLGAPSRESRNQQSRDLLEYTYDHLQTIIPKGATVTQVYIRDGVTHLVDAVLEQDLSIFVLNPEQTKVTTKTELASKRAPVEKGEQVGELIVFVDDEEYGRVKLVANQSTGLASVLRRLWNRIVEFFRSLF